MQDSNLNGLKHSALVLCFIFFFLAASQTIKANKLDYRYTKAFDIQKLSLDEGLSQSVVNQVVQDNNGFIWLATEDGLNRFDGYDFLVYQHDHKLPQSLHENWVISLEVIPNEGLWVGTVSGLSYMDFSSKKFTNFSAISPELNSLVRDILYVENIGVWVGTDNGLFFRAFDAPPLTKFQKVNLSDITPQINSLVFNDGKLLVASDNCIFELNKHNNVIVNLCNEDSLTFLRSKSTTKLLIDRGELWIGTRTGLFQYNLANKTVKTFYEDSKNGQSIASNYIQDLVIDSNNSLWVSTINGISIFNRKTLKFVSHTQAGLGKRQLSSIDIISSFIDKDGLVWLGTYGRGVNLLNPNQQRFEHLFTQQDAKKINSINTIHGIEKDQYENLWLASYGGGLIQYNLMSGAIKKPIDEKGIDYDQYVFGLKIDKSNVLWVATFSEIFLIDLETKEIIKTEVTIDGEILESTISVSTFFEDHSGYLWMLSERGLHKIITNDFDLKDKNIQKIELESWSEKLPYSYTQKTHSLNSMVEDENGNFWIGGDGGLLLYNHTDKTWKHFTYDPLLPNSLSSNSVQTIYLDNQGFVWVGTADGLNRIIEIKSMQSSLYQFDRITTHEGLPSNAIYGIQQDNQSGIWLSTSKGLVKYNRNILKMDLFRSTDGISSDEFNLVGTLSDEGNRIYFSSINGVTSIIDSTTRKNTNDANLKFVKVKLGLEVLDPFTLNSEKDIYTKNIKYGTAIEIWVSAMTYFKFGVSRYRYRINGFDNKWVNLGGNRKLFIAGLAKGTYNIEIQSRISGEPWSSNSLNFAVKINADFFSSKQFVFMAILLLFVVFVVILIIISRQYKRKIASEANKQTLEKLRIKELRIDNDSLIYTISDRDRTIAKLGNELEVTNSKIDIERYRDISTGFYRFKFVLDMREKESQRQSSTSTKQLLHTDATLSVSVKNYSVAAIIEFTNYADIVEKHGALEAKEFLSQVSIELRRETNADTQFYTLRDGSYILFNASKDKQRMIDGLLNICTSFNHTSYEIANGRSVVCRASLTYVDLDNLQINNESELIRVKRLIQIAHEQMIDQAQIEKQNHSKELKILRALSCESLTDGFDFDVLIEDGTLQID